MTTATGKEPTTTHRTPSMFASLVVFGTMIGLILLSVVFFGSTVADGPLQVSMTLATLVALTVAYFYGYRGAVINQAIHSSISGTLGTIVVLLAIGAIIGTLYLSGAVAAFIYYGVAFISQRFFYITVFLIASALSMLLGSSLTTVGGVTTDDHARSVLRTAIPTVIISALLFLVLGLTGGAAATPVDSAQVQGTLTQIFNISLLAFLPVVLIFVLSAFHFSGFLCLMIPAIAAVLLAAFTQPDLITSLAADPNLSYPASVLKVGIDTLANGFHLNSGNQELDKLFSGGGTAGMLSTIWLIIVAAGFGAVADYTGMLRCVVTPVINWTKGPASLVLVTVLTSLGLNTVAADPYVSIVLAARMFRDEFIKERLKPVTLSTAIADSGTIFSGIIPWNVNGALFAGALGMATATYAPFTFVAYLSPVISLVFGILIFRKDKLPASEDAKAAYGKEPAKLPAPAQTA